MNHAKWIAYFNRNRLNRPEPDWSAPVSIPARMYRPLLKSLEQFRLGDGGGPASLIARNAEHFRGRSEQIRTIVDLWFAENLQRFGREKSVLAHSLERSRVAQRTSRPKGK
jgi:hypothetical protein